MRKRGFTLIELLVVIAIIAILASILFPVFAKAREKARQAQCNSNVRQLATAVQMYVQDNQSRFPGMVPGTGTTANNPAWEDALLTYVGSKKIYFCPSDAFADKDAAPVSYGYNGLLVRLDGSGLNEAQVKQPTEVGALCDASPTKKWGFGGLVGGGSWSPDDTRTVKPEPRHGGVIVGYCDGHAKYQPGKKSDLKDSSSLVTRGFYMANGLGLVDNPAGGLNKWMGTPTSNATEITIGGDYCLYPLLTAAAEVWKNAFNINWYSRGFLGMGYTTGRVVPADSTNDWVWGCSDDQFAAVNSPTSSAAAIRQIAKDCVVIIVSKNSKIKIPNTGSVGSGTAATNFLGDATNSPFKNNAYVCTTAYINTYFYPTNYVSFIMTGYSADAYQTYTYNIDSGTRRSAARFMGWHPMGVIGNHDTAGVNYYRDDIGGPVAGGSNLTEAVVVENDLDMVDKVAADPYGIGYCSSVFADLDRVQVLAIKMGAFEYYFPSANIKYRWGVGEDAPALATGVSAGGWPMVRTLYAAFGSNAANRGFQTNANANFGANLLESDYDAAGGFNVGRTALLIGPLFKASYWRLGPNDK